MAVSPTAQLLDSTDVNVLAVKCGYFVMPEACTADVVTFLKDQKTNVNATFLKSWDDVANRPEVELRILQLLHYFSTYGTDYQGVPFVPNGIPADLDYCKLTVLRPCSDKEFFNRIVNMVESGVALSKQTLSPLMEQLSEYYTKYGWAVDVDSVRNREAQARLCVLYNSLPHGAIPLLRVLAYITTGNAMLIKDTDTLSVMQYNANKAASLLEALSEAEMQELAAIFYRYKAIFLALRRGLCISRKNNIENEQLKDAIVKINRIRRLAPRYHKPFTPGILESVFCGHSLAEISGAIETEPSTFKLIRVLAYANNQRAKHALSLYIIRNGKVYFRSNNGKRIEPSLVEEVSDLLRVEVVKRLSAKAFNADGTPRTVRFPNFMLTAPVSERQMIGAVPFGSKYPLSVNNYIGIYWRNEWGTHDFDLWIKQANGDSIGWAGGIRNENILFSGDMTDADPEAVEMCYCRRAWPDSIVTVARYNGMDGSRYRLFFGQDNIAELPVNYMVNPDSITFTQDLVSTKRQTNVAIVHHRAIYFTNFDVGNRRVPGVGNPKELIAATARRLQGYPKLRPLLLAAGFREFNAATDSVPDLDFAAMDKDALISLFH